MADDKFYAHQSASVLSLGFTKARNCYAKTMVRKDKRRL